MTLQMFLELHIVKMQECFRITHFDVEIKWSNIASEMEIDVDTTYLEAQIVYGKKTEKLWKLGNHQRILSTLAHELTHVFTWQLTESKKASKKEERVTEHLAKLLFQLYKDDIAYKETLCQN